MSGPRKHGLLDNIQARFQQNLEERQERVERLQAKREAEIVHSRYLKQHVVDPTQMAHAKYVVDQWAKKHGSTVEKHIKEAIKSKGQTPNQRRRQGQLNRSRNNRHHQHQTNYTSIQQARHVRSLGSVSGTSITGNSPGALKQPVATNSTSSSYTDRVVPQSPGGSYSSGYRNITTPNSRKNRICTVSGNTSADANHVSEYIDVDLLDESMSLGNCVREFNRQAALKKCASEKSSDVKRPLSLVSDQDKNKKLSQVESHRHWDTSQADFSNSDKVMEDILIEDGDDISLISVGSPDLAAVTPDPVVLDPDPVTSDPVVLDPDPVTSDPVVLDSVTPVPVTTNLSGTMCCVVNCGANFSTKSGILEHESKFDHSPCNPLLSIQDCRLPSGPLGYACPKCFQVFKTGDECLEHQKVVPGHLTFLPPVCVACYLCPQCLALFPSFRHCQQHMDQLNHHKDAYTFNGSIEKQESNSPIPVSRALAEDFLTRCRFVTFSVSCLDCTLIIESNTEIVQHLEETNHQHWHFIATASQQQVDVFSKYLESHACSTCDSVMAAPAADDDIHYCISDKTDPMIGQIQNLDCPSLYDFVRRCCISFAMSRDRDLTNRFSCQTQSSPKNIGKKRKRKCSNDSACGKVIKVESSPCAETIKMESNPCAETIKMESSPCAEAIKVETSPCSETIKLESNPYARSSSFLSGEDDLVKLTIDTSLEEISFKDVKHQSPIKQMANEPFRKVRVNCDDEKPALEISHVSPSNCEILERPNISDQSLIVQAHLNKMSNIVFVNLDNWPCFFTKLPFKLPDRTFVWAFCGGTWQEPYRCPVFDHQSRSGQFYLSPPCGHSKDAADFTLCLTFGRMDERLDKRVHFTILSGEHGYQELDRQKETSDRTVVLIDPSDTQQWTDYTTLYTIISSVGDQ